MTHTSSVQDLSFQNTSFDIIDREGHPWLQARQIGEALGYKNPSQKVHDLYTRYSDEFTPSMTQVLENLEVPNSGISGNLVSKTRIFSLRGCHLLAMFSRTPVAKKFRVLVLDVLETLNADEQQLPSPTSRLSKRSDPERKALAAIKSVWVNMAPFGYKDASAMVNAHFGVSGVDEMTVEQCREAAAWVQGKIDLLQQQPKADVKALPPAPSDLNVLLDAHFQAIRSSVNAVFDNEREIFRIIKRASLPALDRSDPRSNALVNMHYTMEHLWYSITDSLKAAEFNAKAMVCTVDKAKASPAPALEPAPTLHAAKMGFPGAHDLDPLYYKITASMHSISDMLLKLYDIEHAAIRRGLDRPDFRHSLVNNSHDAMRKSLGSMRDTLDSIYANLCVCSVAAGM